MEIQIHQCLLDIDHLIWHLKKVRKFHPDAQFQITEVINVSQPERSTTIFSATALPQHVVDAIFTDPHQPLRLRLMSELRNPTKEMECSPLSLLYRDE